MKAFLCAVSVAGLLAASAGVTEGATIFEVDFDAMTPGATTEAALDAATTGGTWTLSTDPNFTHTIASDGGGQGDRAFLSTHADVNVGVQRAARIDLDTPVDVDVDLASGDLEITFETAALKGTGYERNLHYYHLYAGTTELLRMTVDDGNITTHGASGTVGLGSLTPHTASVNPWNSTSANVWSVELSVDSTGSVDITWTDGDSSVSGTNSILSTATIDSFELGVDPDQWEGQGVYLNDVTFDIASGPPAQAGIIIGPGVRNGDFNDDTSATNRRSYAETPDWQNIGTGDQTQEATGTDLHYDSTRNHIVAESPVRTAAAQDTGHTIAAGDFFEVSYVWRDAWQWTDGGDQIAIKLFTTDDDLISGTPTTFATLLSGTSTVNSTYESVTGSATATAAEAGKLLFVSIDTQDGGGGADGFARLDNFQLQVTPIPEPMTMLAVGLSLTGLGGYVRRRRRG